MDREGILDQLMQMNNAKKQMRQQQQINKYVDLIKKYEKRKKSKKASSLKSGNNELLNFTKTVESALFNLNVQKKIRNKLQDVKLAQIPIRPTLKTLDFRQDKEAQMKKTKRKFEVYQQKIEQKQSQGEETKEIFVNIRERKRELNLQPSNSVVLDDNQFSPYLHQRIWKENILTDDCNKNMSLSHHCGTNKTKQKSQGKCKIKDKFNLDGSIFHFDKEPASLLPGKQFFSKMFNQKDNIREKAPIYEMLKTMSPLTIKSNLIKQELFDNKLLGSKYRQANMIRFKQKGSKIQQQLLDQISKNKRNEKMHKKQRSSLVNLRKNNEILSGWEILDDS